MMGEQRRLFRILIDRGGKIHRGDDKYPCKIIDLTEKGFQLESNGGFRVGDELHLEFVLSEPTLLACTVRVTHIRDSFLGAEILRISPDHQAELTGFIDQLNALNMTGF
jgi:hypothetical protein